MATKVPPTQRSLKKIPVAVLTQSADALADAMAAHLPPELALIAVAWVEEDHQAILRVEVDQRPTPEALATLPVGHYPRIALSTCEKLSKTLDALVDPFVDAIPELATLAYQFEVSSPGLNRRLTTPREWAFYHGRPVRVEANPILTNLEAPVAKPAKKASLLAPPAPVIVAEGRLGEAVVAGDTATLTILRDAGSITVHCPLTLPVAQWPQWVVLNPAIDWTDLD